MNDFYHHFYVENSLIVENYGRKFNQPKLINCYRHLKLIYKNLITLILNYFQFKQSEEWD
jgi:hypothetical protein